LTQPGDVQHHRNTSLLDAGTCCIDVILPAYSTCLSCLIMMMQLKDWPVLKNLTTLLLNVQNI